MYEIDILRNNEWYYLLETENIKELDKAVYEVNKKGITSRIIEDGLFLCFIHNDDHGYWFFKNKYVRNKGLDFDYTKSYYEHCKKKELKKSEEI